MIKRVIHSLLIPAVFLTCLLWTDGVPDVVSGGTSGAIIVFTDSETAVKCEDGIRAYSRSMESDGLSVILKPGDWGNPDEIKDETFRIHKSTGNLEGIVLIGDIPVPMILDAQHLTSAFKIDQVRFPRIRTAVPSDRYYDDFDLKFSFIEQDSANALLFYYSLDPDSPQRIDSDIYCGRIKSSPDDEKKYERINRYLFKVSERKKSPDKLNHALVVTGHGYYSESLSSWSGELMALKEQFPSTFSSSGRFVSLYHEMEPEFKKQVISQLQTPGLDLAIFHAHGDDDMQYLSDLPHGESVTGNIGAIRYYLRSKLRQARDRDKDPAEIKSDFMARLDVPESWFEGAFEDSVRKADSLLNYSLDIHLEDIRKMEPQPAVIIFDQCFNGAFIHRSYVAGEYIFGKGNTVATVANSVNVVQDHWADEFIGILAKGVRLGEWHRHKNYLESHILGDPTIRFIPQMNKIPRKLFERNGVTEEELRGYLDHELPVIRTYTVYRLFRLQGNVFEKDLVEIYHNDISFNVRLEALKCLAALRSVSFEELLKVSVNDPYELIRRFSVKWMGDVGRDDYLPFLIENIFNDPAKRVNSNAWDALSKIGTGKATELIIDRYSDTDSLSYRHDLLERFRSQARSDSSWFRDLKTQIVDDSLSLKKRVSAVRTFRSYRFDSAVPFLLEFISDKNNPEEVKITAVEALGWYGFNHQREKIIKVCRNLITDQENSENLKKEVMKTLKRIQTGANNPITS